MKQDVKKLLGEVSIINQVGKTFKIAHSVVKKNNVFEVKIENGRIIMPLFATIYLTTILENMEKLSVTPTSTTSFLLEFDDSKVDYKKLTKYKSIIEEGFKSNTLTGVNDGGIHYLITKGLVSLNNYTEVLFCVYVNLDASAIMKQYNADSSEINIDLATPSYSVYISRGFFASKPPKYIGIIKELLLEPFIEDNDIEMFMNKGHLIYNVTDIMSTAEAESVTDTDFIEELMADATIVQPIPVEEPVQQEMVTVTPDDISSLISMA